VKKVLEKRRAIPLLTLRVCVVYKKGVNLHNMQLINTTPMMKIVKNGASVNPLDNAPVLYDSTVQSL
jgi:hypothetical protein